MNSIFDVKINNFKGKSICFYSSEIYNNRKFINEKINNIENFNKLDLLNIEPIKGNIKINQIREIHEFLKYKPNYSNIKIIIINEIDKMNIQAENSLLKILEEPPEFSIIITHTNSWNDLLSTTRSRLTRIDVPYPEKDFTKFNSIKEYNKQFFQIYEFLGLEYMDYLNNLSEEEILSLLENINSIDFDIALKNLKDFNENIQSKIIFIYSYFLIIENIIIEKGNKNLIKTIDELKDIKNNIEKPFDFLKIISLLSNIFIHDSLISKLTNKWKYMYNYNLIEFFGIRDYKINMKMILDSYKYNNKIINSSIFNHNFTLEIITHFTRINEAYSKI